MTMTQSEEDKLENLIEMNTEFVENIRDHYNNKARKYESFKQLYDSTLKAFETWKGWNVKAVLKKLKGENVDITYKSPKLLLVRINDYETSKKVGSIDWCIVTSKQWWDSYVNEFTSQYFFWDFTKDLDDKKHMIGATIGPGGKVSNAYWANDDAVKDYKYFDDLFKTL